MKEMKEIFKAPSYQIFDFFEFILGIISSVAAALTVFNFLKAESKIAVLGFVVLIALIVIFFLKILKLRRVNIIRFETFSKTFHKFTHMLRDHYYMLQKVLLKKDVNQDNLIQLAYQTAQGSANLIAEALTNSTGQKIFVCIKHFSDNRNGDSLIPRKVEDYYLRTMCRSTNCDQERLSNEAHKVGDNTDFLLLMRDERSEFYSEDLQQLCRYLKKCGQKYLNSTENWEKYYHTTIVVPIRIKNAHRSKKSGARNYETLGFLCADSLSTSAFPSEQKKAYINFLKAFADALYPYFDEVYSSLSKSNYYKVGA